MNIELIDAHHPERDHVLAETFPFLANLDLYYPSISTWFAQSFSQGLAQGKNVLLAARGSEGRLEGVALGKPLTKTERIIVGTMAVGAAAALIVWAFATLT